MRAIKFKGKRIDNGEWEEGGLLQGVNGITLIGETKDIFVVTATDIMTISICVKLTPIPYVSSPASLTRTARRYTRATCCGQTPIRSAAPKTTRLIIITG